MGKGLEIRPANEEELAEVKRLTVEQLPEELNELERGHIEEAREVATKRIEALLKTTESEVYVAVAEEGPGIAGYVWFGVSERPFSTLRTGWIYDLHVVPGHRGEGVGEALLRRALDRSRERGFELAGLMVRANNKVAYSLYEKLGFRPEHVVMTRRESEPRPPSNS